MRRFLVPVLISAALAAVVGVVVAEFAEPTVTALLRSMSSHPEAAVLSPLLVRRLAWALAAVTFMVAMVGAYPSGRTRRRRYR